MLMVGMILSACETVKIPKAYNFRVNESIVNPYGCWTILTMSSAADSTARHQIEGELIYMDYSTTYLLERDYQVFRVKNVGITSAILVTHKNQAGTYALATTIFLVPNIIGAFTVNPGILALGIPVALVGYSHSFREAISKANILKYPQKDDLNNFRIFARFPAGIPKNVNLQQLTLKKSNK
jgi:hypothetical protein